MPILVVDDDPAIRAMYARALKSLGEVQEAEGGRHATELVAKSRYDAIVLDLHMPGVDGFGVLSVLASDTNPNRDTPVLVITGDTSNSARIRAHKLRSLFLLTKPVPLMMMRSMIESALKKKTGRTPPETPRIDRKGGSD